MRLVHPRPLALWSAALFTVLRLLLFWGAMAFTAFCLAAYRDWLPLSLIFIGAAVSVTAIAFLLSLSPRCILCRCTLFLPKNCSKHPNTKKLFGSRLLRMCGDIVIGRSFRCVYCGERCASRHATTMHEGREHADPEDYLQPEANHYRAIWHKPPKPTAEAILTPTEQDQVMSNWSPFRMLAGAEATQPVPVVAPARRPVPIAALIDEAEDAPKPFESALPYPILTRPPVGITVSSPASPFQELWH